MNKSRRIGALVAMATAAAGMATVTTAAPAAAAFPRGPQPVSNWLRSVPANNASWINIFYRTDQRVCDVEVRVRGERVRVDYWGFRRSATLSRGNQLRPGQVDYAKVRVTPYFQRSGVARLWATISYDNCTGWRARTQTRTAVISLPVQRNTWPGGGNGPGVPGHGHPGGPGNGGPGHGTPGNGGPGNGGPGHGTPGNGGPGNGGPGQGTPGNGGPGNGGPGHGPGNGGMPRR